MSADPDSERNMMRREIDRIHTDRLVHLETKLETLEEWVRRELQTMEDVHEREWNEQRQVLNLMTRNVQKILDRQAEHEPAMEALEKVIQSGMVMRWIVLFVITTLAAIGTGATAWDAIKGIFLK
ncbi:MAG: hypothetical protein NHG36_19990 [Chromatiaceae bacterium]|nr:hypothetical protein [Candidatus Thioaporhodococcus sediminis]